MLPTPVSPDACVIFLHIPKTAGTSLSRMIRLKYGTWPPTQIARSWNVFGYYDINPIDARLEKVRQASEKERQRIRWFQGHFGFGVHEVLPEPYTYITMLREPVERVISSYYQLKRGDAIPDGMTLADYVEHDGSIENFYPDNGQVRSIAGCGGHNVDVPHGACNVEVLQRAKDNIMNHFAFVGFTEHFDASLLLLKKTLEWKTCFYARANVAKKRARQDDLPNALVDRIREVNALDIALYDWAHLHFEQQVESFQPGFNRELQRHIEMNQMYAKMMGPIIDTLPMLKRGLERIGVLTTHSGD